MHYTPVLSLYTITITISTCRTGLSSNTWKWWWNYSKNAF